MSDEARVVHPPQAARTVPAAGRYPGHIPGETGIWVFVLGDMCVFGLLFGCFLFYRGHDLPLYLESRLTLNQTLGVTNTLLLLTSSWFVALGVEAARRQRRSAAHLFALGFACGAGFAAVKFVEYGEKIRAGITLTSNEFYTFYYMMTGLHFLHVVVGMVVLVFMWAKARGGRFAPRDQSMIEGGATYWHMVDLLWVVLFALLYLVR